MHANLHAYFKLASNTIQLIESGLKDHSATSGKRPRSNSIEEQRGSDSGSGSSSLFGIGGTHGTRGGGRHEYRYDKGGYYGSGYPRQQKDDNYFSHRSEHNGRRFQGRRPYGGGRGRF